ncbi:DUF4123 domain-containing protein [Pseudomonas huanghezhanensis]|uniref:DUF4123 domain-containing protein n=1 Tax=Pseudomonas huanghezhanensis TaxID=3002903 RepID=UPI002286087B|nr:DUF4123 domain-containing protein [Pseudomonas sp. BSw22131]
MNALPQSWHALNGQCTAAPLVLLDGAMQQRLGETLANSPETALSLFALHSRAAQALGPWLMTQAHAVSLGVNGSARGINWLACDMPLPDVRDHLLTWMRGSDPESRQWLRLADGRALSALMNVWTDTQRQAFCQPWRAWCYADRDGRPKLLELPVKRDIPDNVSTTLDAAQDQALALATLADALLHELKRTTILHASLKGDLERRHGLAQNVIDQAMAAGYQTQAELSRWLHWALRRGVKAPELMPGLIGPEQNLHGDALWAALERDADQPPEGTA